MNGSTALKTKTNTAPAQIMCMAVRETVRMNISTRIPNCV
jgi:hypothetical protein